VQLVNLSGGLIIAVGGVILMLIGILSGVFGLRFSKRKDTRDQKAFETNLRTSLVDELKGMNAEFRIDIDRMKAENHVLKTQVTTLEEQIDSLLLKLSSEQQAAVSAQEKHNQRVATLEKQMIDEVSERQEQIQSCQHELAKKDKEILELSQTYLSHVKDMTTRVKAEIMSDLNLNMEPYKHAPITKNEVETDGD